MLNHYPSMSYEFGKTFGYRAGMRRLLLPLFATWLMTCQPVPTWAQETADQPATFRSGVDLVTVSATVRDGKGRLVRPYQTRFRSH